KISGFYPSDQLREQLNTLLRGSFSGARIEDETKPALGAPNGFLTKATRAIGELARLREGKVELRDGAYSIAGKGPETYAECDALRSQIAQQDAPDSVAQATIACPDAPPPLPEIPPLPDLPPVHVPIDPPAPAPALAAPQQAESSPEA